MNPLLGDMKVSSAHSTTCRGTIGSQACQPFCRGLSRDVLIVKQLKQIHPMVSSLSPLAVESPLPFSSISMDFITGLPDSHGFDSVMVMVDHGLMKGVIYCPCTKNIDTAGVAQLFFAHIFPQFGLHSKVISGRGPQLFSPPHPLSVEDSPHLPCLPSHDL